MAAANIVTGFKEIDAALEQFEVKVQRKYLRQALNNSVKLVQKDFRERCPVETDEFGDDVGAMRDSTKRITPKKKKRGIQIRSLTIDSGRLMSLYFQRKGRFPGARRGDSVPFFYPAIVELGGSGKSPQRPMRDALYGNETKVEDEFVRQMRMAIERAGRDSGADVPEDNEPLENARAAGANVYRDRRGRYQRVAGGYASRAETASARAAGKLYE